MRNVSPVIRVLVRKMHESINNFLDNIDILLEVFIVLRMQMGSNNITSKLSMILTFFLFILRALSTHILRLTM